MQSDTVFPETSHRGSFGIPDTGFVGDWVGGCGVDRMWKSMMCCLRDPGLLFSSWDSQNGHDSGCGSSFSSSPEWMALSLLSSSSEVQSPWVGVFGARWAWLGELG